MSALENIMQYSREEVLEKIAALGIQEYGLCRQPLAERLREALEESREEGVLPGVAAALNNADTEHVLLDVLKADPEKVLMGMAIAAYALGSEKKTLYLPEAEAEKMALSVSGSETEQGSVLKKTAEKYQTEIQTGIVNIRANKGNALLHIVTAAELAEAFADEADAYQPGVYVSVNGAPVKKVACDTKISELVKTDGAKALLLGYKYHTPESAELTAAEAGIENGVVRVLTEKDCIVAETEKKLLASRKTSCGKCVFCREGLIQLQYMQKEITDGRGKMEYLDLTKEIGEAMCDSTPCTMGQTCAKIALTAVEQFAGEYEAHIKKKNCPAGVCTSFVNIYIDPQLCDGCGECMDVCPKDCIEGKARYIHMIDDFDCTKCGKCIAACEAGAIKQTTGKLPKLPNRLTKVGKFKKR